MKIPNSVRSIYEEFLPAYGRLKELVDARFRVLREPKWHYESRVKEAQSFALKLETGRVHNPREMEDYFGCCLVVENRAALARAEQTVRTSFDFESRRPPDDTVTHKRSDAFPFDDLRLYVRWHDDAAIRPTGCHGYLFEVQIRTFLQHAWAIATHDLIYKSASKTWGKERLAYQIKAMLEHAEIAIQEAEVLSETNLLRKTDEETKEIREIIEFLNVTWSEELLPTDKTRLAINIQGLLRGLRLRQEELVLILEEETKEGRGKHTLNLSPFYVVLQSLLNHQPSRVREYLQRDRIKMKVVIPREIILPSTFPDELANAVFIS